MEQAWSFAKAAYAASHVVVVELNVRHAWPSTALENIEFQAQHNEQHCLSLKRG